MTSAGPTTATGAGSLRLGGAADHWYAWHNDFGLDNARDPFKGGKVYEDVRYALEIKVPFVPLKNGAIAHNEPQQDRDAQSKSAERLFAEQLATTLREVTDSVAAGLNNLTKLPSSDGPSPSVKSNPSAQPMLLGTR